MKNQHLTGCHIQSRRAKQNIKKVSFFSTITLHWSTSILQVNHTFSTAMAINIIEHVARSKTWKPKTKCKYKSRNLTLPLQLGHLL